MNQGSIQEETSRMMSRSGRGLDDRDDPTTNDNLRDGRPASFFNDEEVDSSRMMINSTKNGDKKKKKKKKKNRSKDEDEESPYADAQKELNQLPSESSNNLSQSQSQFNDDPYGSVRNHLDHLEEEEEKAKEKAARNRQSQPADDYMNRLAAKQKEFALTPSNHNQKQPGAHNDTDDLEELIAMKKADMNMSFSSVNNGSFAADDLLKAKYDDSFHHQNSAYVHHEQYPDEKYKQDYLDEKYKHHEYADEKYKHAGYEDEKYKHAAYDNGMSASSFQDVERFNPGPDVTSPHEDGAIVTAAHGRVNEPHVEYGQFNTGQQYADESLAVAVAISPDEEDAFIPAAIEYDPDSKPPIYKNRRFRMYFIAAAFLLIAIGVSVALGLISTKNRNSPAPTPSPTTIRESLGIQEQLIAVVGEASIDDETSPHARAAEWLLNLDPQVLPPEADNLIQRYLLAVFYFSTTEEKLWLSCNQPTGTEGRNCNFTKLTQVFPDIEYESITWTRWLSDSHECEWAGVFCDEFNQTRAIELPGQQIRGTFPTELALMPYLQSLTFNWNSFHGTLPSELATMKHLLNIELHYNEFTGNVPSEWYSSQALQRVNFAGNFLSGTIPTEIGELSTMKGFFTFENFFTGTIPTEIGNMKFLSFTRWGRNLMTGTMPSEIGKLEKLQEMWMHRNLFTGTLPTEMGRMRDMGDLRLHFNIFAGPIQIEHYEMPQLRRWDLYDCNMTGTIATLIGKMTNLQTFRIRENNFHGTIPTEIGLLSQLDSLWMHQNDLTGTVPNEICALRGPTGITVLDVDCGPTDNFGAPLIECKQGCCTACCDTVTGVCLRDSERVT